MRLNVEQVPQNKIIVYEVRLKGVQTIEFCFTSRREGWR